ncbi:phenylalanine--tRNA ligase beta subunit-related protein [Clostridioides difficile]
MVDLGNSISLKYLLPMGAHDMDFRNDDVYVRFSKKGINLYHLEKLMLN